MTQELRGALIALAMAFAVFAVAAAIAQPMTIFHWTAVRLSPFPRTAAMRAAVNAAALF